MVGYDRSVYTGTAIGAASYLYDAGPADANPNLNARLVGFQEITILVLSSPFTYPFIPLGSSMLAGNGSTVHRGAT